METFKNEEEFVEFIKKFEIPHPYIKEGIGDDCSILEIGNKIIAITTDSYKEEVHFKTSYLTLEEIAYRCTAGALSDLAACGAKPIAVFISLFLPENFNKKKVNEFYEGVKKLLKYFGTPISGGDLVKSRDKLSFTITCIGEIDDYPLLRKGAEEGDLLCLTGDTGKVLAALEIFESNLKLNEKVKEKIIHKFKYPRPKIAEMIELKEKIRIKSAIDISDGISKDAKRLSISSKVKLIIEEEKLPISKELLDFSLTFQKDVLYYVLNSGEEYEILFTISEKDKDKLPNWVNIIGVVEKGEDVFLKKKNGKMEKIEGGYDHFI